MKKDANKRPSQCMNSYAQKKGILRFTSHAGRLLLLSLFPCKRQLSVRVSLFDSRVQGWKDDLACAVRHIEKPKTWQKYNVASSKYVHRNE